MPGVLSDGVMGRN